MLALLQHPVLLSLISAKKRNLGNAYEVTGIKTWLTWKPNIYRSPTVYILIFHGVGNRTVSRPATDQSSCGILWIIAAFRIHRDRSRSHWNSLSRDFSLQECAYVYLNPREFSGCNDLAGIISGNRYDSTTKINRRIRDDLRFSGRALIAAICSHDATLIRESIRRSRMLQLLVQPNNRSVIADSVPRGQGYRRRLVLFASRQIIRRRRAPRRPDSRFPSTIITKKCESHVPPACTFTETYSLAGTGRFERQSLITFI